ncbi:unnamed protein product [Cuscuta epithymum]|uniref:F-box domain-containing protein n=1 Tax=Cuscuta epithymum TaxID=186058 RepID=A0AAV0C478_9ASTE|nr:unnamed protein product [Cuscuta epithymum]
MDFWLSGIADNGEGIDIISSLPDEVLVHILSFLPTKHAVGTSILSHRWQYLFTGVTKLDFDESLMFRHNGNHSYPRLKASCTFKDFVDRVLPLCKSPRISKFRLKCEYGFDCSNLNAWITFALY